MPLPCQVEGDQTTAAFTGLTALVHGLRYYTTVHAYNLAGLSSYAASDGLVIDTTAPLAGPVRHGISLTHDAFQASAT